MEFVSSGLSAAGVQAEELSARARDALVVSLRERFGIDVAAHQAWDNKIESQGKLRSDGWELIPTFVGDTACHMFLDGAVVVWKFSSGSDLLRVLTECPALEFYICDEVATYLLCSNHHDFLIGWGAAKLWVDHLGSL
jgi:hypothetical protein